MDSLIQPTNTNPIYIYHMTFHNIIIVNLLILKIILFMILIRLQHNSDSDSDSDSDCIET